MELTVSPRVQTFLSYHNFTPFYSRFKKQNKIHFAGWLEAWEAFPLSTSKYNPKHLPPKQPQPQVISI